MGWCRDASCSTRRQSGSWTSHEPAGSQTHSALSRLPFHAWYSTKMIDESLFKYVNNKAGKLVQSEDMKVQSHSKVKMRDDSYIGKKDVRHAV